METIRRQPDAENVAEPAKVCCTAAIWSSFHLELGVANSNLVVDDGVHVEKHVRLRLRHRRDKLAVNLLGSKEAVIAAITAQGDETAFA